MSQGTVDRTLVATARTVTRAVRRGWGVSTKRPFWAMGKDVFITEEK